MIHNIKIKIKIKINKATNPLEFLQLLNKEKKQNIKHEAAVNIITIIPSSLLPLQMKKRQQQHSAAFELLSME